MADDGLRPLPEYEPPARPMPLPKGVLPAGKDVDKIVRYDTPARAYDAWFTHRVLRSCRETLEERSPHDRVRQAAEDILAQAAPVTALQALIANRRAVDELMEGRQEVVQEALEGGASWDEIGEALEMVADAARRWYGSSPEERRHHGHPRR